MRQITSERTERARLSLTRALLHLEGAALLLLATAAYFRLGQPWWLFLLLLLAPDLSLLGLLAGPRVGAVAYDAVHTMVGPLLLLAAGWWLGAGTAVAVALVWLAHLGMDRMLGLGLRYADGRNETHMGRV